MKVHFIAIGGAVMHNLAIALHKKGHQVSGSDDQIFEPSRSRLDKYGLLPSDMGWCPEKLDNETDAVILGMHAVEDNPELKKAQQLGVKVYSFPSFMYEQCKNKKRVVIAGSHGKTTITSMILHVLKQQGKKFDYLVGSQIDGFETMAGFSEDSEIAVFEGDEYLTSPLDRVPKFYHYKPHLAVLSGIEWDHFNVYPTFENYVDQFKILIDRFEPNGKLFFDSEDRHIPLLELNSQNKVMAIPYKALHYTTNQYQTVVNIDRKDYKLKVFGNHNMKNLNAARLICMELGIQNYEFFKSMASFVGAKKRLEPLVEQESFAAYIDFAHAPSKVKATVSAVKEKHADKELYAFLELHTFSSLNKDFLPQYKDALKPAEVPYVFVNQHALEQKKLEPISESELQNAFNDPRIRLVSTKEELLEITENLKKNNNVWLFMSSGNFSGVNIEAITKS